MDPTLTLAQWPQVKLRIGVARVPQDRLELCSDALLQKRARNQADDKWPLFLAFVSAKALCQLTRILEAEKVDRKSRTDFEHTAHIYCRHRYSFISGRFVPLMAWIFGGDGGNPRKVRRDPTTRPNPI